MSIGENVRSKRIALKLTQKELADAVGVDKAMICQIERGSKTLSMPLGKQIAEIFKCSLDSLVK